MELLLEKPELRTYQTARSRDWIPTLRSLLINQAFKLCHPDRRERKRAKWRDLVVTQRQISRLVSKCIVSKAFAFGRPLRIVKHKVPPLRSLRSLRSG